MRGKLDETSDSDPLGGSLPPPPSNSEKCEMRCIEVGARVVVVVALQRIINAYE